MREVASRASGRRWQIRLFSRATSFFITGQKSEFGVGFFGGVGGVMGTAEESLLQNQMQF